MIAGRGHSVRFLDGSVQRGAGHEETDDDGHNHMPSAAAVKIMINTYLNAPSPIVPHIDVGNPAAYIAALGNTDAPYFVPADYAKGGDLILEQPCGLAAPPCQFDAFPGTIGWQANFDQHRKFISIRAAKVSAVGCFTRMRAADLGRHFPAWIPTARKRCIAMARSSALVTCSGTPNPDFRVPSGKLGIAQTPGGKVLVSTGLWDRTNFVGTDDLIAITTLHELGHNGGLWHGGPRTGLEFDDEADGGPAQLQAELPEHHELLFQHPRLEGY